MATAAVLFMFAAKAEQCCAILLDGYPVIDAAARLLMHCAFPK
jgi:hypothetical protein